MTVRQGMMTLHVFNPEHDIALAGNLRRFTPPAAARRLQADMDFLPALWAANGDAVLVGDAALAECRMAEVREQLRVFDPDSPLLNKYVRFVTSRELPSQAVAGVDVWGWDAAIHGSLLRMGVPEGVMPDCDRLASVRDLSHRRHVSAVLAALRGDGVTGMSFLCESLGGVERLLRAHRCIVVKAPWSCSGRGIRFVTGTMSDHQAGWIKNMLKAQGNVVVEPYYEKVSDFGMEFFSDGGGTVAYRGLSVFDTDNWAYAGSLLATEAAKEARLNAFVCPGLLAAVRSRLMACLAQLYRGRYRGPFGVDMMIVRDAGGDLLLHPCVEINLRRTMGHAAIALSPAGDNGLTGVMRIEYANNNYKLKINSL